MQACPQECGLSQAERTQALFLVHESDKILPKAPGQRKESDRGSQSTNCALSPGGGGAEGAGKKGSWLSYLEPVIPLLSSWAQHSPGPGRHSLEGVGRGQGEGRSSVGRCGDARTLVRRGVCPGRCVRARSSPTAVGAVDVPRCSQGGDADAETGCRDRQLGDVWV